MRTPYRCGRSRPSTDAVQLYVPRRGAASLSSAHLSITIRATDLARRRNGGGADHLRTMTGLTENRWRTNFAADPVPALFLGKPLTGRSVVAWFVVAFGVILPLNFGFDLHCAEHAAWRGSGDSETPVRSTTRASPKRARKISSAGPSIRRRARRMAARGSSPTSAIAPARLCPASMITSASSIPSTAGDRDATLVSDGGEYARDLRPI